MKFAGLEVLETRITYLAYAPEIAAAMLQRQQAEAVVDARELIVVGAVGVVQMAWAQPRWSYHRAWPDPPTGFNLLSGGWIVEKIPHRTPVSAELKPSARFALSPGLVLILHCPTAGGDFSLSFSGPTDLR